MIYVAEVTTPASQAVSSPLITRLKVTKGLVYKVEIYQPHGAMGLHYVQVWDGGFQCWPTTPGSVFRGDGIIVDFEDTYLKYSEPFEFQVKSWNLDTTYEHLCVVRIGMVSEPIFMARFLPSMTYDKMLEVLRKTAEMQEAERKALLEQPFPWLTKGE